MSFAYSPSTVNVNLATGANTGGGAQGDVLTNVDQVQGSAYDDTLTGNRVYSGLDGYLGNDTLIGGGGYDVYYFAQSVGYGQDTVYNGAGSGAASGEIDIGMGLGPNSVWFSKSGNDLIVSILGTTSQMTVKNWFANASAQLQQIVAGDGSAIGTGAIGQLEAAMASYQANNPSFNPQTATALPTSLQTNVAAIWGAGLITGTGNADTLDPGVGNTTLIGNGGNDTYEFRPGYGTDVIVNGVSSNSGPTGVLQLAAGLDPSNLWFTQSGNDLVIQVLNQPAQMTIQGWFAHGYSQLQSLQLADGSQIGTAAVSAMAAAMTSFETSSGFNPTTAIAMPASAVEAALTANWSRGISTRSSNTILDGIYGADTLTTTGSNDTLIGGSGASMLVSNANGNTLEAGTGPATAVYEGIANLSVNLATDKATVAGSSTSDTLVGISGASVSGSNDTLVVGAGTDTLTAAGSSDSYQFALGAGQAIIHNGANSNTTASNELDFGTGISDQNLWFMQSGNDLQIDVLGTSSEATVAAWFSGAGNQLSEITAGGLKLDGQVSQLVQAMATYSANNPGFNPATIAQAPNDATLQNTIAAAWHS